LWKQLFWSTGIGLYTVAQLAKRGAKVYLGARDGEKAKAAIEKLRTELGDNAGESDQWCPGILWLRLTRKLPTLGDIIWLDINLTYPRRAKEAAEFILAHEQRLDILSAYNAFPHWNVGWYLHAVNNAGK
jgi:NAD(P)-dependent dehydrogenase (short-subunit alcohol dehydrogenase family)